MRVLVITDWGYRFSWHLPQLGVLPENESWEILNIPSDREVASYLDNFRQIVSLIKKLNAYDVLVFRGFTRVFMLFSFLFKLKVITRPPKVVLAEFALTEDTGNFRSKLKYSLVRFLLMSVDKVFTFNESYTNYLINTLGMPAQKFSRILLAVNHKGISDYPKLHSFKGEYVLAPGRSGRDYRTMFHSIKGLTYPFNVVSDKQSLNGLNFESNVIICGTLTLNKLYEAFDRSKLVVVPLYDSITPTGLRMIFFGMERAKCVVFSKSRGITENFRGYKYLDLVSVEPGNAEQLRNLIVDLMSDDEKRERIATYNRHFVETSNTSEHYISKFRSEIVDL